MKFLVVAIGSDGDVLPLVGLAHLLQQRGHLVTFFSNAHFAERVRKANLDFVAIGTAADYQAITDHPDLWNKYKGWQLIGSALVSQKLEEAYHLLASHVVPNQTVMLSSTLGFAGRLLQETHAIPHATVHLSPGVFHSAYETPKAPGLFMPDWLPVFIKRGMWTILDHLFIDPVVQSGLNRLRHKLGLPPVSRIFHEWLHSPNLVLCLFPEWFAARQPDWPSQTRVLGFPLYDEAHEPALPTAVQKFLEEGAPPLVFTPGSANSQAHHFFEEAAKACTISGRRGIFLTQYPEQLPDSLPDIIQHFLYLPLSQLLPRSAALIHHGGIGTCAQALRAGIPQLIQPLSFDQFDNAARITRFGVGDTIPSESFQAPKIAQHIQLLLSSRHVTMQCATISQRFINHHPLVDSCDIIESTLMQK